MTRTDIINTYIYKYNFKTYLEIGVRDGANFDKIKIKNKISVDPYWPATYKITSNNFFISVI